MLRRANRHQLRMGIFHRSPEGEEAAGMEKVRRDGVAKQLSTRVTRDSCDSWSSAFKKLTF